MFRDSDYDVKVEFEHKIDEGPNKGTVVTGSLHIVAETVIVHINEMEDAYIFTPLHKMPNSESAVLIKHLVADNSEMVVLMGTMTECVQQFVAQFSESVRLELIPLLREYYVFLRDTCGEKESYEALNFR